MRSNVKTVFELCCQKRYAAYWAQFQAEGTVLKSILHGACQFLLTCSGDAHLDTMEKLIQSEDLMRASVRKEDEDEVASYFAALR